MADSLEIRRTLSVPVERVFAAWTDPDLLARWMTPIGHARVEADVRVGGRLRVIMVGNGRQIEHVGEYMEVAPPHRLSFTWQSEYTGGHPSRVTVKLVDRDGMTELTLRHELLPHGAAASHAGGWGTMLERLADEVGSMAEEVQRGA